MFVSLLETYFHSFFFSVLMFYVWCLMYLAHPIYLGLSFYSKNWIIFVSLLETYFQFFFYVSFHTENKINHLCFTTWNNQNCWYHTENLIWYPTITFYHSMRNSTNIHLFCDIKHFGILKVWKTATYLILTFKWPEWNSIHMLINPFTTS